MEHDNHDHNEHNHEHHEHHDNHNHNEHNHEHHEHHDNHDYNEHNHEHHEHHDNHDYNEHNHGHHEHYEASPPPPPPPQFQSYQGNAGGFPPPQPHHGTSGFPPAPPPPPPGFQYPQPESYPGKGMSIAAMVLGICSLIFPGFGVITAIIGLILGISGKRKADEVGAPTGMATAGVVMSIIAIALSVLTVIMCIAVFAAIANQPMGANAWWWQWH